MKLSYQQLPHHLSKTLAPIYFVSGDETLLVQEVLDTLRQHARQAGFTERVVMQTDASSEWSKNLSAETHSLSLFATKRVIEVRIPAGKANATTGKQLQTVAADLPADNLLLISSGKLDTKTEQTAWYKALDKLCVMLPLWPINAEQLPAWIMQRGKQTGVILTADAAKLLAEQVEGNLLAAAQEIEKLALLQPAGIINASTIEHTVTDNARFDIFGLVDCALAGDAKRCLRVLNHLQAEGIEPVLVLWALAREIRTLLALSREHAAGTSLASLFAKYRVWEKRQRGVRQFLQAHDINACQNLLLNCSKIDQIIKGARPGNVWDELQLLTLQMTGNDILTV